jgi:hypothetical protein
MKILACLLLCAALAGCGGKTEEDIAKELITEKLKASLPDFGAYSSLNFGAMGTAFLPYEETSQYAANIKSLNSCRDSIAVLEKIITGSKAAASANRLSLQQLTDRVNAKLESNKEAKQAYVPEKLFKLTHAYTLQEKDGQEKKTEDAFFIDKDLKRVVKVVKVY